MLAVDQYTPVITLQVYLSHTFYCHDVCHRLTNALIEISVLPTAFLSPLMVLEVIDLTDNDLTLLDPKTFSKSSLHYRGTIAVSNIS